MSDFKQTKQWVELPNAQIELRSEAWRQDGFKPSDTQVIAGGETLFCISGDNIDDFKNELAVLVEKYSI